MSDWNDEAITGVWYYSDFSKPCIDCGSSLPVFATAIVIRSTHVVQTCVVQEQATSGINVLLFATSAKHVEVSVITV